MNTDKAQCSLINLPIVASSILLLSSVCSPAYADNTSAFADYKSPYSIKFSIPLEQLSQVDAEPPRDNPKMDSETPHKEWLSRQVQRRYGSWGPAQRKFPALKNYDKLSPEWKRERVLAVAVKYIGLSYQHHHIPDFRPPDGKKGLDCSNFTSWVYNYGLGIKLNSAIEHQAENENVIGPGGEGTIRVSTIRNEGKYADLVKQLKTGDLLYIRNKAGKLAHVIMWVGDCGVSPDNEPLIIDSTGPEHRDCQGNKIPGGIQLRPFPKNSWYFNSFDHAHRIILD